MVSDRQKDHVLKLVRELLKEVPLHLPIIDKLCAAVLEIDELERRRKESRRRKYRGYLKKYGVKEGRRLWRQRLVRWYK